MKKIFGWYYPFSKRSENYENYWRQVVFIYILFLLSFIIYFSISDNVYDLIIDFYIRNYRSYERELATYGTVAFQFIGTIMWFYASWLICWSSKWQMEKQGFGKFAEITLWLSLAFHVYLSTIASGFNSFQIFLPILVSIFPVYLLLNGFLKQKGIDIHLMKRIKKMGKGIRNILISIGKKQ